jgi:type IV pilus assembly protein PilC
MPKFIYTAKHMQTGESRTGSFVIDDEKALAQRLRAEGLLLVSSQQETSVESASVKFLDRFQSVPLKERMIFARNLSVMVSSGLTISRSLSNLIVQTRNPYFKKVLVHIFEEVQGGKTLSDGLAQYPSIFSELFVNMVYVGEVSGNLDKVLDILAVQLEKENDLISKVKGALTYPSVVVVAMIAIAFLMLTYVLPKILGVFQDMNVTLPPMTVFVINLSHFMQDHSIIVVISFAIVLLFLQLFLRTASGKRTLSFLTLRMPIVSNIIIKVNCARFARIYSALLKSGVSVVEALNIVSRTLSNVYYKDALKEGVIAIQQGNNLSMVIASYPKIFPVLVSQMIEVGEETGKTEVVLEKLAEFYEAEVDQITKNLSSIIEPLLMLLIGGMVGFFAVAMMQPMYSVLENIK